MTQTKQSSRRAMLRRWLMASAATALTANLAAPAHAQQVAQTQSSALEEIVVTAQRREQSLQDTPISITAFTPEIMKQRNFANLSDLSRATPNLVFDTGTGNTGGSSNAQVFIRGIGQTDFLFTVDPGVGIYIDEVYYPRAVGAVMEMADFERIEVLRGPQGTLFGKNTIGGALNITTKRPGNVIGGSAEITVGSRDRIDAKAAVDIPVSPDKFNVRLSALTRNQDGFVKRVTAKDGALGDTDMTGGRLVAVWTPSDEWSATFALDGTRRRERSMAIENAPAGDPLANPVLLLWNTFVGPLVGGPYDNRWLSKERENYGTDPSFSDLDTWGASLTLRGDFGDVVAKSITAYREQDAQFGADVDLSPLPYMSSDNDNRDHHFSQELQLSGEAAEGRFNWVAGGFYFNESAKDTFNIYFADGLYAALESLPAALIPLAAGVSCPAPVGVFAPCAGGRGNPLNAAFDLNATLFNDISINSYAAYGQGSYKVTDAFSATVGLRYTYEKKKLLASMFRNNSKVFGVPLTTSNRHWDSLSPKFGLEYQANDDVLLYASASRGFKGGGFNGRATSPAEINSFNPELVWSYEAGMKSELLDQRLRFNGAVFWSDYSNMQLTSVRNVGGVIVAVTENAGKSRIRGTELEMTAQLTPAVQISGGLGYTDAEYRKLDPGATVTLATKFPKIPKWTLNGALTVDVPLANFGALVLNGDIAHRSSYFNDVPNSPVGAEDGVTLLGARATLRPDDTFWEISLFGTNLTDARYVINSLNSYGSFGTADRSYGRPREWGLSLSAKF